MSFARKFKAAREKAGLSVADAAHRIGVTRATVYLWESGKRKPPFKEHVTQDRALQILGEVVPEKESGNPKG